MANNARLASWPDIPATRQEYRTSAVRASFRPNKRPFVPAIRGREITGYMKQIATLQRVAARMNFNCLALCKYSLPRKAVKLTRLLAAQSLTNPLRGHPNAQARLHRHRSGNRCFRLRLQLPEPAGPRDLSRRAPGKGRQARHVPGTCPCLGRRTVQRYASHGTPRPLPGVRALPRRTRNAVLRHLRFIGACRRERLPDLRPDGREPALNPLSDNHNPPWEHRHATWR